MKILALESSATAASAAICEEETLIGACFQHTGLTHSQTLLPMVQGLLDSCGITMEEIGLIGVAAGPGSFTGLRIGVSLAKGLSWAREIPCAACSTLEAMAWNAACVQGELCCVMDARRGQVYHARFRADGEQVYRLTPDRAISLEELATELTVAGQAQILIGDGAKLCYDGLIKKKLPVRLAPPNLRLQHAWGVARVALELSRQRDTVPGRLLRPTYLRLSQAERERQERQEQKKKEETRRSKLK